jgi:hypothetical protein
MLIALLVLVASYSVRAEEHLSVPNTLFTASPHTLAPFTGYLHSATAIKPSQELLARTSPGWWRSGSLTTALTPRRRALGATGIHVLSDVWRYPADGAQPPFKDLAAWRAFVEREARRHGPDVIYDVWNEPAGKDQWLDWFPPGPDRNEQAFRALIETYVVAYEAVRSVQGDRAKIAGPSPAAYNVEIMRAFLDAMLARSVKLDTLAWHEFPKELADIEAMEKHIREARSAFVTNPRYAPLGIRQIIITEAMGWPAQVQPAAIIAHYVHAELGGASGMLRACWDEPGVSGGAGASNCWNNSLDGLLTTAGAPRAGYFATVAYARSRKNRLGAMRLATGIYAIASRDEGGRVNLVLANARSDTVVIDLPRLDRGEQGGSPSDTKAQRATSTQRLHSSSAVRPSIMRLPSVDPLMPRQMPMAQALASPTIRLAPGEVALIIQN